MDNKAKQEHYRELDGRKFYRLGSRFDVIEDQDGTLYFRDILPLTTTTGISPVNTKVVLTWLRKDGKELEAPSHMLDSFWNKYQTTMNNERTIREFNALFEEKL